MSESSGANASISRIDDDARAPSPARGLGPLLLGLCALGAIASLGLGRIPGFHPDEANFVVKAFALLRGEAPTLIGTNPYTGSLYTELLAASGTLADLPGRPRVMNLGLLLLACAGLAFALPRRARAWLPVGFLVTPLLWAHSRLSWEVTALQPPLFAVIYLAWTRLLRADGVARASWGAALAVGAALGVFNHIIFLTALLALAGATAWLWRDEQVSTGKLAITAAPVLGALVWHRVKLPWLEPWAAREGVAIVMLGWAAGQAALALAAGAIGDRLASRLERLRPALRTPQAGRILGGALLVGLAFWAFKMGGSFAGAWIGQTVFVRWFGDGYPAWIIASGLLLLGGAGLALGRAERHAGTVRLETRLLLMYLALFCAVTTRPHERHQVLGLLIFAVWLATGLAAAAPRVQRGLGVALSLWIAVHAGWFAARLGRPVGPPVTTHWLRITDVSSHFMPFDRLIDELKRRRACTVTAWDVDFVESIQILLDQRNRDEPQPPCAGDCHVDLCPSCPELGWFSVRCPGSRLQRAAEM